MTKPFASGDLVVAVRRAVEARSLRREVEVLRRQVGKEGAERLASQMGNSPEAKRVVEQVTQVAASDFTALILGETRTGKELIAQAIHQSSTRQGKPFVALDCGAIPGCVARVGAVRPRKGRIYRRGTTERRTARPRGRRHVRAR